MRLIKVTDFVGSSRTSEFIIFPSLKRRETLSTVIENRKIASYSFYRWVTLKPRLCFSHLSLTRFRTTFGISCSSIFRFPWIYAWLSQYSDKLSMFSSRKILALYGHRACDAQNIQTLRKKRYRFNETHVVIILL